MTVGCGDHQKWLSKDFTIWLKLDDYKCMLCRAVAHVTPARPTPAQSSLRPACTSC